MMRKFPQILAVVLAIAILICPAINLTPIANTSANNYSISYDEDNSVVTVNVSAADGFIAALVRLSVVGYTINEDTNISVSSAVPTDPSVTDLSVAVHDSDIVDGVLSILITDADNAKARLISSATISIPVIRDETVTEEVGITLSYIQAADGGEYDVNNNVLRSEELIVFPHVDNAENGAINLEAAAAAGMTLTVADVPPHECTAVTYSDNGDGTHDGICDCDAATVVVDNEAHADENADNKCDKCDCDLTPAAPAVTYTFGHNVQLKVLEPWGMYFNAYIRVNGVTLTKAEYDNLADYGAYILRDADWDGEGVPTADEIMASQKADIYSKTKGNLDLQNTNTGYCVAVTYDKDIFTYEMENPLYVVFFAKDAHGVQNGGTRERSFKKAIDTYKNNSSNYSANLLTLCDSLINMYEKTMAYRTSAGTVQRNESIATSVSEYVAFATEAVGSTYTVGHTMQLFMTEPWALRFNAIIRQSGTGIDYSICSDYGFVIYADTEGKYSSAAPTVEQLIAEEDALVYSKLNGAASTYNENDGTIRITCEYAEEMYTYQVDRQLYAVVFAVIDGEYHYGDVKARQFVETLDTYINGASYAENLKNICSAMKSLFAAIVEYRANPNG